MDKVLAAILTIVSAIITVAIISVLVSNRSQTSEALGAAGSFFSRVIAAAVSPSATAGTNGNPASNPFASSGIDVGAGGSLLDPSGQWSRMFAQFYTGGGF